MDTLPLNETPVNKKNSSKKKKVSITRPLEQKETGTQHKKLSEYQQTKPEQLSMFELTKPNEKSYFNSIEFYDAIPKYCWDKQKKSSTAIQILQRSFSHKGIDYEVMIQPATLKDKMGNLKTCFPGEREELVEDALRKLACEGKAVFLDDSASVTFTLYEVEQELKRMGHWHNKEEIKEAIMVCNQSHIKVMTKDGKAILGANFFVAVGLQTQEDWKGHGKKTQACIIFNPLVTKCIKEKTFRLLNYDKSMSYKRVLARWFHKRLSHNYTQASPNDPYTIKLSTILRDSGMTSYKNLRDNNIKVKKALNEMKEKEVLEKYDIHLTLQGRKIVEAKFTIYPHPSLISEVKFANKRYYEMKTEEHKREIDQHLQTMKNTLFKELDNKNR